MDYIEIVETWLKEYSAMKLQSDSLKELYDDKEKAMGTQAIDYSKDKLSNSYKFSSETENLAMELLMIYDRKKKLDSKLAVLDKAINKLSIKDLQIIKLRYIEQKRVRYTDQWRAYTWREISQMIGYEESWCKRIRKASIEKLANIMFGK